jgi:hypothetical protein
MSCHRGHYRRHSWFDHAPRHFSKVGFIMIAVGAYLLAKGAFVGGAIVLAIGAAKLGRWARDPRRTYATQIHGDASAQGVRVPRDYGLWQELNAVYGQRARVAPSLAADFDDVLGSMWAELRMATTVGEWRRLLAKVRRGLVDLKETGGDPIGESLERFRRSTQAWREAEREARGAI